MPANERSVETTEHAAVSPTFFAAFRSAIEATNAATYEASFHTALSSTLYAALCSTL